MPLHRIAMSRRMLRNKMNRTFQQQFHWYAKACLALFALIAFYLFWQRMALAGSAFMVLVVFVVDYVVHSRYTFMRRNGIEILTIEHGRCLRPKVILLKDITACVPHRTLFGLVRSWVLHYGRGHIAVLQPCNGEAFMEELNKRKGAI